MQEQLEDFNYEKAKANPELVRFEDGEKPDEIVFLKSGIIIAEINKEVNTFYSNGICIYAGSYHLKLAKQKEPDMFINLYQEAGRKFSASVYDSIELANKKIMSLERGQEYLGVYKLVKVKENENI